jgi:hypothetical protein
MTYAEFAKMVDDRNCTRIIRSGGYAESYDIYDLYRTVSSLSVDPHTDLGLLCDGFEWSTNLAHYSLVEG